MVRVQTGPRPVRQFAESIPDCHHVYRPFCGQKLAYVPAFGRTSDNRDCRFQFIDGPLTGFGGTCGNLPVVFVAIGRRLGYPLWLVQTHDHCFARWDGGGERFNIECTCPGLVSHSDEYYRTWSPWTVRDEDVADGRMMANLLCREELAFFVRTGAHCACSTICGLRRLRRHCFTPWWLMPRRTQIYEHLKAVSAMRRMIRLAEEQGNREGPLSIAVEQAPYPAPADPWEAWAVAAAQRIRWPSAVSVVEHRTRQNPPGLLCPQTRRHHRLVRRVVLR